MRLCFGLGNCLIHLALEYTVLLEVTMMSSLLLHQHRIELVNKTQRLDTGSGVSP
jgi:hypothetical protein